jgi:hypothetical protein
MPGVALGLQSAGELFVQASSEMPSPGRKPEQLA